MGKIKCKICDEEINTKGFGSHLRSKHNTNREEYFNKFEILNIYDTENPKCEFCGKYLKESSVFKDSFVGYGKYCNKYCANRDKLNKNWKNDSMREIYLRAGEKGRLKIANDKSLKHKAAIRSALKLGLSRNKKFPGNERLLYIAKYPNFIKIGMIMNSCLSIESRRNQLDTEEIDYYRGEKDLVCMIEYRIKYKFRDSLYEEGNSAYECFKLSIESRIIDEINRYKLTFINHQVGMFND